MILCIYSNVSSNFRNFFIARLLNSQNNKSVMNIYETNLIDKKIINKIRNLLLQSCWIEEMSG